MTSNAILVDISWMIGGPQGSGVDSGASVFMKVLARYGYRVFGTKEFFANIKGEHSHFVSRISDEPIHSNVKGMDLLAAFDAETVLRHFHDISEGIIYNSDLEGTKMEDVPTIDGPDRRRIGERLESRGKQQTVAGALEAAAEVGVRLYPVSFSRLLDDLAEKANNLRLRGRLRVYNTIAVALSLGLLGVPLELMLDAIGKVFGKNVRAADMIKQTAEHAYGHAAAEFDCINPLPAAEKQPRLILASGFHGPALGKIACGCRLQAYYPITPATDESFYLESNAVFDVVDSRPGSIAVVQTEDELAAIGVAVGGSLTGARSSTSTSGPGLSLMVEILGWAAISETPLVITDYQRSGPSTGVATKHGQDDLVFAISAGHGDLPKIVYASGTVEESFYDTGNCFNYADIFQVPVIHLMDRFLVTSVTTCKRFEPRKVTIKRGKMPDSVGKDYRRFEITKDGISPRSRLGLDDGIFWTTGTEANEAGHLNEGSHNAHEDDAQEDVPP